MKEKQSLVLPVVLMLVFALTRWPGFFPAGWSNFSAAYGLLFCAGVYFPRAMAWWLPLTALLLTNVLLNRFYYEVPILNGYMLVTAAAYVAVIAVGRCYSRRASAWKLLSGGLLGAIVFYLISNTASWIYEPTQPYPRTLGGWLQALTVGTSGWPETWKFFRNTLLSGGLFTGLFVGTMKIAEQLEEVEKAEIATPPGDENNGAEQSPTQEHAK